MPDRVAACPAHSFFAGDRCPDCGHEGETVLPGSRRRQLSKFCSGALRHFPEDAGLTLDDGGWTPLSSLVAAVESKYDWADEQAVRGVIATDPKGRFEVDTERVRAAYGHSVDVDLDDDPADVPGTLYHGTAPDNRAAIEREGLKPMGRQQVHLSGTVASAREVGARHAADPIVFVVDAAAMLADGHTVTKRGRDVYTTDRVPPAYLDAR